MAAGVAELIAATVRGSERVAEKVVLLAASVELAGVKLLGLKITFRGDAAGRECVGVVVAGCDAETKCAV